MRQITAAIATAFGQPLTLSPARLRSPGPGQVEVATIAVAVCHSDITYLDGGWGGALPAVYGHEAAGIVTSAGPGVALAPGTRVVVTLIRSCGTCPCCTSGRPVLCEAPPRDSPLSLPDGGALTQGLRCGAFASHMVVDASQVAPIPDDLPADLACLLGCAVITGLGAVFNTARLQPGESAVVIGAGGVGLNAVMGASIAGARAVVAVDPSAGRRAAALTFGATATVDPAEPAPWKAARSAIGRGADVALVTVGAIPAIEAASRYLAPGGRVILVGMPHSGARAQFEPVILSALGHSLIGCNMGDTVVARDIPRHVQLWRDGRLPLDRLASHRWPFARINEAIAAARAGEGLRHVITMDPAG